MCNVYEYFQVNFAYLNHSNSICMCDIKHYINAYTYSTGISKYKYMCKDIDGEIS